MNKKQQLAILDALKEWVQKGGVEITSLTKNGDEIPGIKQLSPEDLGFEVLNSSKKDSLTLTFKKSKV